MWQSIRSNAVSINPVLVFDKAATGSDCASRFKLPHNESNQPKLSILLATASINTPGRTTIAEPTQQQSTPRQAKLADPQEAGAPERAALEEPLVVDHLRDASASAPSVPQMADTRSASSATPMVAEGTHGMQPPLTANDGAAQVGLTPQPPCSRRPRPKEKRMRSPVRPRFSDRSGCRGRDLTTRVRSARRIQRCHVSRCHDPGRWQAALARSRTRRSTTHPVHCSSDNGSKKAAGNRDQHMPPSNLGKRRRGRQASLLLVAPENPQ